MASEVAKVTQQDFDLDKALKHVRDILSDNNDFNTVSKWSDLNTLTYKNGRYIANTALFVDIRESSQFLASNDNRIVARLYRSYISEVIMILKNHSCCNEINIVGDCVSAIFTENEDLTQSNYNNDRSDIIEALKSASMIRPTVDIINTLFSKKYDSYTPIKVGIGIASGKALIIKTGQSRTGISKPIFLGENVNLASHLCDKANTDGFSPVLVDEFIKKNSTNYPAGPEPKHETFADWLNESPEKIDEETCYGGDFYRINIHDKLTELENN